MRRPSLPLILALLALPLAVRADDPRVAGIPRFHQVTEHLYRGGQPAATAWPELAKLGVRTVLDLRQPSEHSTTAESLAVVAAGMRYVNFPMDGFATPTAEQLATPLGILDGPDPVFIHCRRGCDRTGTVIAAYRISRQRWENPKALAEARSLGMAWYEGGMKRFIGNFRADTTAAKGMLMAKEVPPDTAAAKTPAPGH